MKWWLCACARINIHTYLFYSYWFDKLITVYAHHASLEAYSLFYVHACQNLLLRLCVWLDYMNGLNTTPQSMCVLFELVALDGNFFSFSSLSWAGQQTDRARRRGYGKGHERFSKYADHDSDVHSLSQYDTDPEGVTHRVSDVMLLFCCCCCLNQSMLYVCSHEGDIRHQQ